jgi:uncharacterized membrane protein
MNKLRIEALSDGIFAIVMTLLVIEIKVPELKTFSEEKLWSEITHSLPLFASFFLSFALLSTYYTTHHFLFSMMAKNINRVLFYLNILMLSFVCLIPFSAHLLGAYPESQISIRIYSLNILVIAILTLIIREYIRNSASIENRDLVKEFNFTKKDRLYGNARIIIAVLSSLLGLIVSYFSTTVSIAMLIIPILFGVIPGSLAFVMRHTRLDRLAKDID